MATNITPELLKQIQDWNSGPLANARPFTDPASGRVYQSNASQGWGQDGVGATSGNEFYSYDPAQTSVGQSYDRYSNGGDFTGQGQFQKVKGSPIVPLLAAAGMYFGLPALMGAGSSGAGAAGAGLFNAAADSQLANLAMGSEAFGGYGLSGAGLGQAAGGAFNAAADSQLANLGIDAAGGNSLAGYTTAGGVTASPMAAATGAGSGGLMSGLKTAATSLIPGGASGLTSLLGPAATALGALAGAQGKSSDVTQTSKMDPRMDPYIYGDLLPRIQGLLAKQTSPEFQAQNAAMRNVGAGLLAQPIAGNGFSRFAGGK